MKNLKLTSFFILLTLIVTTISPVFAEDLIKPSIKGLEIDITNLEEPIVNAKPNFDYDVEFDGLMSQDVDTFDSIYWLEYEEDYEDIYDDYDNVNTFSDMYNVFNKASRASYHRNYELGWSKPPMQTLTKFLPEKTYAVVFAGTINKDRTVVKDLIDLNSLESNKNTSVTLRSSSSSSPVYATVNGKDENVFTVFESPFRALEDNNVAETLQVNSFQDFDYRFAIVALYETKIPTQDYKATVNWINAEGKIPESFILKLMNGTTVVKEQVITKDNAVDEDTWEYDFGEYPTLDDNGNEITYTLAYSEGKDGDLKFFESNQDGFVINNTYIAPEISSKVKMRSIADREINNVKYRIDYNASIKKYSGNADIVLTTTLPFAIDEAKSDLDDGTYDAKTKTITWNYTIENIDKMYDYSTTKNIDLYATAVLPYAIEAKTVGEVTLSDAEGFSESVDVIDNIEAGTGNPKTGDTNLQKYLSIGLIGLAAILMVVSIRRKYSTRKSKVQF